MSNKTDDTVNQATEIDEQGVKATDHENISQEPGLFPVDSVWFTIGFYTLLFVWALYLLYEAFSFSAFEDYALPFLMIPIVLLLIPIKLFTVLFPEAAQRIAPGDQSDPTGDIKNEVKNRSSEMSDRTKGEKEKYELIMIAWVVALPFMMYVIGMGWSIILYVFGFTWYFTRDLKTSIGVTVGVTAFITVLFMYILDMIIWNGILGLRDPLVYLNGQLEIILYRLFGL